MKISYSCLPNIKSDISKHNIKIQKSNENIPPHCNCRDKSSCPMPGRCATTNVVYQATVTREDQGTSTTYTGLASNFKERWSSHKTSFKHERYRHSTKLSGYIWSLKDQNIPYNIRWDFLGRASSFNPATSKCRLCLLEKFFILYHPDKAALNQRSELFSQCLHKRKNLLYNEWKCNIFYLIPMPIQFSFQLSHLFIFRILMSVMKCHHHCLLFTILITHL